VSLLQFRPDTGQYRLILGVKGDIQTKLGQYKAAEATFRQADEAFAMAERNGTLTGQGYESWMLSLIHLGNLYLNSQQLESAKRCFLRVLDLPHQRARDRGGALQGLALYHKERKDWPAVIECCKQAFLLFPEAEEELRRMGRFEERLLLLLADAAEAQGDMGLARRYGRRQKRSQVI
jgi:tetratricopeptide (TPR) repeat protein